ncbi:MAG TPA: DUF1541 domain-containing protein [Ureibacillus sp.]|nr:DUF1541 domain-containing protein [Ureibacillus sp.]
MTNKLHLGAMSLFLLFILTACGANEENSNKPSDATETSTNMTNDDDQNTSNSNTNTTATPSEIPEGIKEAENPKFKVGDQVIINAEHEEDMKGSQGEILGAYDTIVYSVSFTPTTGDYREENHKWVVQEELQGLDEEMLAPGSEVIIDTDQEEGMQGAEGEIDTAEKTIVYMVQYVDADGTMYQKWFKESELSAK